MYESGAIAELKADALKTFAVSHEVSIAERKRGFVREIYGGLIDSILRVLAPMF